MRQAIWTDRLVLLPLTVEYAAPMGTVLADPALHRFIGGEPLSRVALRERYERLIMGSPDPDVVWLNWVIQLRAGGVPGRHGSRRQSSLAGARPVAEIAWVVGTPWQGQGWGWP